MNRICLKLIAILIFSLFSITSFSQGLFWRLNGNNNVVTGTSYLGTNNNRPVDFRTFGIPRMRLTQGGRLGLGTTTPLSLFEINGTALGTGEVFSTNGVAGQNTFWRMSLDGLERGALLCNANDNFFRIRSTAANSSMIFETNGPIERMRLTAAGRLGIATTAPAAMLDISGNQGLNILTGEVFRTSCSAADTYWRMFAGAQRGAIFGLTNDNHFRMQSMTPNAKLIFHTSFTTPASQVVIDPASTERMSISLS